MRIAVLEAVSAGLCGDHPPPSLLAEGLTMWWALMDDLLAVPSVHIETVIDDRWCPMRSTTPRINAWHSTDARETMLCWEACLEATDAAWIIAPECDGLLQRLVEALPPRHRLFNAAPEAIQLCADKLALAQHFEQHGVSTIPTVAEAWASPPRFDHPFVIKPRDGAGSQSVFVVEDLFAWERARDEFQTADHLEAIRQPFLAGNALSIAGWFHTDGVQWFPVASQLLDENFIYHGGSIPGIDPTGQQAVQRLASDAAATIPGLEGYIGFDVILPLSPSAANPILVEINPRLTTSSLGYRRLCAEPWLAALITEPQRPLTWRRGVELHFTVDGVFVERATS